MSQPQVDIDVVVREVMRRLCELSPVEVKSETNSDTFVVDRRLVTLADVVEQLNGHTRVSVPSRAVVTPAVRDYVRQNGVVLERRDVSSVEAAKSAPLQQPHVSPVACDRAAAEAARTLVVGVAATRFDPSGLLHGLRRRGIDIEQLAKTGLDGVTEELCLEVARGGRLGVLLTGEPQAAACRANRNQSIRAAWCPDMRWLEQALQSMDVNVCVVDPRSVAQYQLQRMIVKLVEGLRR